MQKSNNSGVTLLEILLSAIIFVISVAGIFATLAAVRTPVAAKESALTSAVFGKQILETLRNQVDASTYYNACVVGFGSTGNPCKDFSLSLGTHGVPTATLTANGLQWPSAAIQAINGNILSYTVSCADGSGSYGNPNLGNCGGTSSVARRVDLSIKYP